MGRWFTPAYRDTPVFRARFVATLPEGYAACCEALRDWDFRGELGSVSAPTRVLVDSGPDVRAQLLTAGVATVDGVVYTHAHADHTHGIDDLRVLAQNARRLVDVYADDATAAHLEKAFAYCFTTASGGLYPPILKMHRIVVGMPFTIGGPGGELTLMPLRQIHGDIDSLCLRVGRLAYSCDISDVPAETERARRTFQIIRLARGGGARWIDQQSDHLGFWQQVAQQLKPLGCQ